MASPSPADSADIVSFVEELQRCLLLTDVRMEEVSEDGYREAAASVFKLCEDFGGFRPAGFGSSRIVLRADSRSGSPPLAIKVAWNPLGLATNLREAAFWLDADDETRTVLAPCEVLTGALLTFQRWADPISRPWGPQKISQQELRRDLTRWGGRDGDIARVLRAQGREPTRKRLERMNNYGILNQEVVALDYADAAELGRAAEWLLLQLEPGVNALDAELRRRYCEARDREEFDREDPFDLDWSRLLERCGLEVRS